MAKIACKICGNNIEDNAVICIYCGINRKSGKVIKAYNEHGGSRMRIWLYILAAAGIVYFCRRYF